MSAPQSRHAAADTSRSTLAGPKATRTVRFWTLPVVITLAVLGVLAAFYLGAVLRPMTNLRHFPVAILNEDAGPTGAQVVKAILSGFDNDAYDVHLVNHDQAKQQMDNAQIYGVAVIPPNFSSKLQAYAKSALTPGRVERPIIIISTNPRAGALGASIAGQALQRAVAMVDHRVGERLSQEVAQQTGKKLESGAATLLLANPIEAKSTVHNALPDGTGNGLSASYYALLLLLAGFVGSLVIGMTVNSMLGLKAAAIVPVRQSAEVGHISRFRTLLIKWAMTVALALLASAGYILIATKLGMPVQNSLSLWLFGVLVIAAVGITSTSLVAALGGIGVLVSLFVFVVLGLPTAGETVPVEAIPAFFGWLSKFDPMHQTFLGARALLYLDGRADTGLSHSLVLTAIGLLIGLLFGVIVTRIYDRRNGPRPPAQAPAPAAPAAVSEPAAPTAAPETTAAPVAIYPEP
jgi:YhgE/Pip-like protein